MATGKRILVVNTLITPVKIVIESVGKLQVDIDRQCGKAPSQPFWFLRAVKDYLDRKVEADVYAVLSSTHNVQILQTSTSPSASLISCVVMSLSSQTQVTLQLVGMRLNQSYCHN